MSSVIDMNISVQDRLNTLMVRLAIAEGEYAAAQARSYKLGIKSAAYKVTALKKKIAAIEYLELKRELLIEKWEESHADKIMKVDKCKVRIAELETMITSLELGASLTQTALYQMENITKQLQLGKELRKERKALVFYERALANSLKYKPKRASLKIAKSKQTSASNVIEMQIQVKPEFELIPVIANVNKINTQSDNIINILKGDSNDGD